MGWKEGGVSRDRVIKHHHIIHEAVVVAMEGIGPGCDGGVVPGRDHKIRDTTYLVIANQDDGLVLVSHWLENYLSWDGRIIAKVIPAYPSRRTAPLEEEAMAAA